MLLVDQGQLYEYKRSLWTGMNLSAGRHARLNLGFHGFQAFHVDSFKRLNAEGGQPTTFCHGLKLKAKDGQNRGPFELAPSA